MGIVGSLIAKLILDKTGFRKGLESADKDAKQFKSKSGNTFKSVAKVAAGAFMAIASAAIATGGAALKAAADFEKQKVAFEVMLGSAGKAQTLLEQIEEFSATTPFQMPGLIEGTKRLLAFGVAEGELIEKMKNLGNAAMGNQEVLGRLVDAYGKLRAKGTATMEELNRFTEAGVPIVQTLADQYEVSTGELLKMVSQGKVSFQDVDKALTGLTTGTGKFAGMIEKQAQTLGGVFSTLKDNIGLIAKDIGTELAPAAKEAIGGAIDFFQKNRSIIVATFTALPKLAMETFQAIGKIIERTFSWDTISGLFSAMWSGMINQFKITWEYFPKIAIAAIDVITAPLQAIGEFLIDIFKAAWVSIKNTGIAAFNAIIIGPINDMIEAVNFLSFGALDFKPFEVIEKEAIPAIREWGEIWDKNMKEGKEGLQVLADTAVKFVSDTTSNYASMFSEMGALYEEDVTAYLDAVDKIIEEEKKKLEASKQAKEELSGEEVEIVKEKTKEEIELEIKRHETLLELYGTEEEQFIDSIEKKAEKYKELLGEEFDAAKWTADQIAQYRKEKEEEALQDFKNKIQERLNTVNTWMNYSMGIIGAYYDYQSSMIDANTEDEKKAAYKKAKMARQQFMWNKLATLVQIGIDTAGAAIKALPNIVLAGIITAMGIAKGIFVAAKVPPPLPTFQHGGWVGGMSGIDRNMIMASQGEFVVNRESARNNRELLESINAGKSAISIMPSVINIVTSDGRIIGKADLQFIQKESKYGGVLIHPRAISEAV
jgi:tape measure domain-containing protein